jgi:hypothetical protein
MQASVSSDSQSAPSESVPVLRVDLLDELMAAKGAGTPTAQARAFGLNVTHWFDIRSGRAPNLTLKNAQKIAAIAGTTVDVLWGRS